MQDLTPPRPRPTPTSRPFWEGLDAGRVRLQQCTACGGWIFYPRNRCPHCLSAELAWHDVTGNGTLYTWTVCERPTAPHYASWGTYVLAVVELEEGVRMTSLLVDADPAELRAGLPLEPVFERPEAGAPTLLHFRPARGRPARG